MDQFIKEVDIKTVISIVRESKLGRSCWAVTQRGRRQRKWALKKDQTLSPENLYALPPPGYTMLLYDIFLLLFALMFILTIFLFTKKHLFGSQDGEEMRNSICALGGGQLSLRSHNHLLRMC